MIGRQPMKAISSSPSDDETFDVTLAATFDVTFDATPVDVDVMPGSSFPPKNVEIFCCFDNLELSESFGRWLIIAAAGLRASIIEQSLRKGQISFRIRFS